MRKVHLIRHGATEASRRRLYYGAVDIPLAPDAAEELLALKQQGIYPEPDGCRIYTSGMLRANQTLEILYPGLKAETESDLREMNFGAFELRGYEELKDDPQYQQWLTEDYLKNICPGGESSEQHGQRSMQGLMRLLKSSGDDLLIVCHGGTITCLMERLFPNEGENRWFWECKTGRGFTVSFEGLQPTGWTKI